MAKDRNGDSCRNYTIANDGTQTQFCKLHQYMCEYTHEMMESTKLCNGCKKMKYMLGENKTCDSCRSRDKTNYKKEVIKCAHDACKFKRSVENAYCGKHQLQVFVNATVELGKKVCFNHIRGCRAQLDADCAFSRCQECLDKENAAERARRHGAITAQPTIETNRICSVCCKEKYATQFMATDAVLTKTCQSCRLQNKIQDAKRDREHRNEVARKNINRAFYSYQKDATRRGISFHLNMEDFVDIIKRPCAYCGNISEEKQFNGIDRVDSTCDYVIDNCVSACTLCNYLKHVMPVDLFFSRVEHILTYSGKIQANLHPDAFPNFISGDYAAFVKSANIRNIEFRIVESEFLEIVIQDCYLCGKSNQPGHRNGIDRFDNSLGYTNENARPCCNTCNIMKNRFSYADIMDKFEKIYKNRIQ